MYQNAVSGYEITFYCVHDADGPGTVIYEALQKGTAARPGRKVKIINLGLEPAEGRAMGLQVEEVKRKKNKAVPVADYVEDPWRSWLQKHRIELNAMTTPEFIEWLDRKFAEKRGPGKIIPPTDVLEGRLATEVRKKLRDDITAQVLREADVDGRVEEAGRRLEPEIADRSDMLPEQVAHALQEAPEELWEASVTRVAAEICDGRTT